MDGNTKYLNIEFLEDFRTFKSGNKLSFEFSDDNYIIPIVGRNGSGKSTLVNILRDYKCNNLEEDRHNKLMYSKITRFKDKVNINTNFKSIYYYSSEFDDPLSMNNSADATAFIENGGYMTMNLSTGERQAMMLGKWIRDNSNNWNNDTLLVFDEMDKGFDILKQIGTVNMYRNFHNSHKVSILTVTHSLFTILKSSKVMDISIKSMISSDTWISINTNSEITIKELNKDEVMNKIGKELSSRIENGSYS